MYSVVCASGSSTTLSSGACAARNWRMISGVIEILLTSCAYHADEAVNVPFGVEQMRRNANPSLAQTHDNLFPLQLLIKLGSFLRSPRGKAAVRPALCRVWRTGRNATFR